MNMAISTKGPGKNPSGVAKGFTPRSAPRSELDLPSSSLQQDYLHVLSHDLQGSLQVIAGAAMLLEQAGDKGNQRLKTELCEKILANVEAVTRALREIVEIGAMEHGVGLDKSTINVEHFVLRALDQGVVPLERPRIEFESSSGLPLIEADEPKLRRAFLNLIHNALKFSPPETLVNVKLYANESAVILSVHDHGPGLTRSEIGRLFQKYRSSPQSRRQGGSGLGLYGCSLIVRAHGGRCRVESSPNTGTTFTMELPAKANRKANR